MQKDTLVLFWETACLKYTRPWTATCSCYAPPQLEKRDVAAGHSMGHSTGEPRGFHNSGAPLRVSELGTRGRCRGLVSAASVRNLNHERGRWREGSWQKEGCTERDAQLSRG